MWLHLDSLDFLGSKLILRDGLLLLFVHQASRVALYRLLLGVVPRKLHQETFKHIFLDYDFVGGWLKL